ncbi:MAG: NADH-quinone oxidoreductase subunit J [Acidimicrobiia bacterium]|nr:NADH-quinone oxidoreductase subunit J [Acidimicrobiia bacterium]
MVDVIVFAACAAIIVGGALGVVLNSHPVRAALSLVASFFGVAVLFIQQGAHFLALVQIVVYAGAIVVLFLFVIMLLGVDRSEDLTQDPLTGQRPAALLLGVMVVGLVLVGLFLSGPGGDDGAVALSGRRSRTAPVSAIDESQSDIDLLADDLYTRNVLAVEATALLLTIATVGAVVLVRNRGGEDVVVDEPGSARR